MDAWSRIIVLSIGGALGANARYWLGVGMARWVDPRFPWSTVTINITGSFAIGFLSVVLAARWPNPLVRLFVITGVLGGYTTFSAFSFESFQLWEGGSRRLAAANSLGSGRGRSGRGGVGGGVGPGDDRPGGRSRPDR